jgi:hypothetical protein
MRQAGGGIGIPDALRLKRLKGEDEENRFI